MNEYLWQPTKQYEVKTFEFSTQHALYISPYHLENKAHFMISEKGIEDAKEILWDETLLIFKSHL